MLTEQKKTFCKWCNILYGQICMGWNASIVNSRELMCSIDRHKMIFRAYSLCYWNWKHRDKNNTGSSPSSIFLFLALSPVYMIWHKLFGYILYWVDNMAQLSLFQCFKALEMKRVYWYMESKWEISAKI